MTKTGAYAEWQKLCDEYEAARESHFQAFTIVNKKFASIAQGTSSINPTDDELSKCETTWKAWEDIQIRMKTFVKEQLKQ